MILQDLCNHSTPGKFQDYLTCPLQYKLKHVEKIIQSTHRVAHFTIMINKAIEEYFIAYLQNPGKNESIKSKTEFCVDSFIRLFSNPMDDKNNLYIIDWKNKSKSYFLDLGCKLIPKIFENTSFRNIDIHHIEKTIPVYLIPDPVNKTFIQTCQPTKQCFTYDCKVDGITKNNTLLNFSTSYRKQIEDNVTTFSKYGFYDLAMNQLLGCPKDYVSKHQCYFFIRSDHKPRIQLIEFQKTQKNRVFLLEYLYKMQLHIDNQDFEPSKNVFCQSRCHYRKMCSLYLQNESN